MRTSLVIIGGKQIDIMTKQKVAVCFGCAGQSGSYLAELLLSKNYRVFGVIRRSSTNNLKNLINCLDNPNFSLEKGDVTDAHSVFHINNKHRPDELYNLAAQSHVGTSFEIPSFTMDTILKGTLNNLEWLRENPKCRMYTASSSEMFGFNYSVDPSTLENFQNEDTPMSPNSPYGVAKLAAHNLSKVYRESYDLHVSCGILFNHESARRGHDFVTQKIITHAVWYQGHCMYNLELGDIDSSRDWSHAKDMVNAMWLMLQQEEPDDYVVGSGITYTIREFVEKVRQKSGFRFPYTDNCRKYVRPLDVPYLRANPAKAKIVLGWKPAIDLDGIIDDMLEGAELERQHAFSCS